MSTSDKSESTDEPTTKNQSAGTGTAVKELTPEAQALEYEMLRREMNVIRNRDLESVPLPDSWESAFAALASIGAEVDEIDDVLVDEWPEIDKDHLINREILLMTWSMARPENSVSGRPYLVIRGITTSGTRFRFSDGGTGICKQLCSITDNRVANNHRTPNAGLHLPNGLTVSKDYVTDHVDPNTGEPIKGTTYYLNPDATKR